MKLCTLSRSMLLALATAAPLPARAQDALPSAREIVDHFAAAAHLKESLAKASSMHVTGSFAMEAMGLKGTAEIWSAKPDRRFVKMQMGAFGDIATGFDGQTAWMTHTLIGARVLKGTEFLQTKLEAIWDGALKSSADYESMRTLGRETFEGKDCYKVEFVARPLDGMDPEKTRAARTSVEYYEVASGLQAGTSGHQEGELGSGPFTTILSDYKDFGGQLVATKTRVRQAGQEIVLTVDSIEFDVASPTTFALPLEIQRLVEAGAAKPADAAKPDPKKKE